MTGGFNDNPETPYSAEVILPTGQSCSMPDLPVPRRQHTVSGWTVCGGMEIGTGNVLEPSDESHEEYNTLGKGPAATPSPGPGTSPTTWWRAGRATWRGSLLPAPGCWVDPPGQLRARPLCCSPTPPTPPSLALICHMQHCEYLILLWVNLIFYCKKEKQE